MEFNVKKLVGDAGTLFTRAVQVPFPSNFSHLIKSLTLISATVDGGEIGNGRKDRIGRPL